jgi:predicted dehydrogenase
MTDRLRWGVIGSGGIARRRTIPEGIVPASNAGLAAVFDVNGEVNARVAGQFGARACGSVEELLAEKIDAVYVASPADAHYGQALECAAAGKHVLCEKPLGMSVAQAEEMVARFRAAGLQLGTGLMMRFHSQHQAALQLIRDGALGTLTYGRAQLSCWYPPIGGAWRQDLARGGGGSLIDMGGHAIDLLEMFFGPAVQVCCFTGNLVHNYEPEDSAVAMLRFESGAMATVDTFFCIPDASSLNALEIYGSNGSILAKGTIGQGDRGEMVALIGSGPAGYDAAQQRAAEGGIAITPEPLNMYRAEIEAFSAAVLSGRPVPVDGEAGLRSQRILAACYESARQGGAAVGATTPQGLK